MTKWLDATENPKTRIQLVQLRFCNSVEEGEDPLKKVTTIIIDANQKWHLYVHGKEVPATCTALKDMPTKLDRQSTTTFLQYISGFKGMLGYFRYGILSHPEGKSWHNKGQQRVCDIVHRHTRRDPDYET